MKAFKRITHVQGFDYTINEENDRLEGVLTIRAFYSEDFEKVINEDGEFQLDYDFDPSKIKRYIEPVEDLRAVDYRLGAEFGERHSRSGREFIEHVDRGVARARARAPRLGDVDHEESLAAGLGEPGGDRLKTQSIGIGFDHGGAFDGEEPLRQRPPVRLDGIEIDRQRSAGFRVRRRFGRFGSGSGKCHPRVMTAVAAAVKPGEGRGD